MCNVIHIKKVKSIKSVLINVFQKINNPIIKSLLQIVNHIKLSVK